MKKTLLILPVFVLAFLIVTSFLFQSGEIITGAPPYDPHGGNVSQNEDFSWLNSWKRPAGPAQVALQVGHWKNDEVPDELHRLRENTGATGGGYDEWEVNYEIAIQTKELLEEQGITVHLLPATIPPRHWSDVFVSIHADGSLDLDKSGFKVAAPRRDRTEKADDLVRFIEDSYSQHTKLHKDPNITRNMRGYYAFSWSRYEHAVHPMTVSAILETGFLTSPPDRETIVDKPDVSAHGLAEGIIAFLESQKLL